MLNKIVQRRKRHGRIRKKLTGDSERPRLSVYRSLNNLFVQVIDDSKAHTLLSTSTSSKKTKKTGSKTEQAQVLGKAFGEALKQKGIQKIAFDRGGYKYHGRIKALAESMREAGIQF